MSSVYVGCRTPDGHGGGVVVTVNYDEAVWPLPLRLDLADHSPTGFEWGCRGSGCAQLACALVADACGDRYGKDPAIYQHFKERTVMIFPHERWQITGDEIRTIVSVITAELDSDGIADVFPDE